jgi:hypothetical protein
VSSIHPADRRFHHEDGSHRWSGGPPDRAGQDVYQSELRAHMDAHRAQMRVPRQRTAPETRRLERAE